MKTKLRTGKRSKVNEGVINVKFTGRLKVILRGSPDEPSNNGFDYTLDFGFE